MAAARAVLDASALLAVIDHEAGLGHVAARLHDAIISAVDLSEGAARLAGQGYDPLEIAATLFAFKLDIRPFDLHQAPAAASLRPATRSRGLSFGDRACLALARSIDGVALTADRAWAGLDGVEPIR